MIFKVFLLVKCYLLGAGASYGYDEKLFDLERPPLSYEFFLKGERLGIFTKDKYPNLYQAFTEYRKLFNTENPDIEKFLSWLATNFFKSKSSLQKGELDEIIFLQCSLGESFYFIYEILKHYSLSYKPRFDSYRRLALHYYDEKYNVITLNYDTLFENAILSVKGIFHYPPSPKMHPNSIPIVKLHGSINWFNSFGRAIAYEGLTGKEAFKKVVCSIFSNRSWIEPMKIVHPLALKEIDVNDLIRSGMDYDEPALIPPLEDYKDYEKVQRYKEIWSFAENILRDTNELVIIGCSLRREDKKLKELLSSSLRKNTCVTIVNPHSKRACERLSEIIQSPNCKSTFRSFADYARTL